MTDKHDMSEMTEIIRQGFREQSAHPEGLNSSQTHSTLYPADDPRNKEPPTDTETKLTSSKLMRTGIGSRQNWK